MGYHPREIRPILDDIIDFSGLGNFIDLPMRGYSSGMVLRLAFSIATSVKADIVLMDEWLSFGDTDFNTIATERLLRIIDQSSILVFATHSTEFSGAICNKSITLNHGRLS
jgi:lipopolysaccharide transport system ATP-binding protein